MRRKINVVPCLTSEIDVRFQEGEKLNFVYIGSTSEWQCIDETFRLYKKIASSYRNTSFTLYTSNKSYVKELNEKYEVSANCKYVKHGNIDTELRKYDFGFLLRKNHLINEVSSPVKFLEYVSNGVIPIMTKNIGDYSQEVLQHNIGIIIENINDIEKLYKMCFYKSNIIFDLQLKHLLRHGIVNYNGNYKEMLYDMFNLTREELTNNSKKKYYFKIIL